MHVFQPAWASCKDLDQAWGMLGSIRSRYYDMHIPIDDISGACYDTCILAHLRGCLRRRAEGGAGSGVLRPRLVTKAPGGSGPRPPGTTTRLRGARCTNPEEMPEMEARPPTENRRGGAPKRRARPAGRAPRLSKRGSSRPTARQRKYCAFRRSARPSRGGWNREKQNPGAATRGGNEEHCAV
jgi:hypothetical protein